MAPAESIPDRAQSIERGEILTLVFSQVGPQTMLEPTTPPEWAFTWRELRAESSRSAQALFVAGLAKTAVCVLTFRLLLFAFLFIVTLGMRSSFSSVVGIGIGNGLGLGRNQESKVELDRKSVV